MIKKWLCSSFVLVFVVVCISATEVTAAARPNYLIVRTPARKQKHRTYVPARGYAVTTTPYAYGWFGAKNKRHWVRNTGVFGDYLQWSVK